MSGVAADLALQLQSLLLRRFSKLSLKRILLSPVPLLFSQSMAAFTLREWSALASLIKSNRMSLVLLTPWTVCSYFLGNVHYSHNRLCIRRLHTFLYFFAITPALCFVSMVNVRAQPGSGQVSRDPVVQQTHFSQNSKGPIFVTYALHRRKSICLLCIPHQVSRNKYQQTNIGRMLHIYSLKGHE